MNYVCILTKADGKKFAQYVDVDNERHLLTYGDIQKLVGNRGHDEDVTQHIQAMLDFSKNNTTTHRRREMYLGDMKKAINDAENTLMRAESCAGDLAKLLKGRLRQVGNDYWSIDALKALKKELQSFNAVTGQWKD